MQLLCSFETVFIDVRKYCVLAVILKPLKKMVQPVIGTFVI